MGVMSKKRPGHKVRVDFRQNRQVRRRSDEWTQRFRAGDDGVVNAERSETVRAKGDLSRKRTILVDENALPLVNETQWRAGTVTKVHGLLAYVTDADGAPWECSVRRILRTRLIENRAPLCVGDRVWLSDQRRVCDGEFVGVIERVAPRTSQLARRDRRQRAHSIVANADQLVAVVSVAQPRLRPHLVDRYIVAALTGQLTPVLCFNKIDLLVDELYTEDDDAAQTGLSVRAVIDEFRRLGYRCLCTSAVTGAGLDELRAVLKDHLTVLSGQSGVGKSTLLNMIQPGWNLAVQEVSAENEKGRHTTTLSELMSLDFGGFVVDTPGIRAFDLWAVAPGELEVCFVEMIPYVPQCRFHDCMHRDEDGCAVRAAVETGAISARRYYSYLKMFEEV
jgi:ribosome biogenesis GTPase